MTIFEFLLLLGVAGGAGTGAAALIAPLLTVIGRLGPPQPAPVPVRRPHRR